jgi:multidrug resistance efflux pump
VQRAEVRAEVGGIISRLYVSEGDAVEPGAPIALLADRELEAALQRKKADLAAGLAQLQLVRAGPRREEIALAKATYEKTQEQLNHAKRELARNLELVKRHAASRKELEETQGLVAVRRKELEENYNKLKLLQAGSRPEEIAAVLAETERLQAEQRLIQEQLEALTVLTPIGGIVTTHRLREKIGQSAVKGDLIAEVHDLRSITAEIAIPEKELDDIAVGHPVVFKARAYPSRNFQGTVSAIAPVATKPEGVAVGNVVLLRAQIPNQSGVLKSGMTGIAKISCGERSLLDVLVRKFRYFVRLEVWGWW